MVPLKMNLRIRERNATTSMLLSIEKNHAISSLACSSAAPSCHLHKAKVDRITCRVLLAHFA